MSRSARNTHTTTLLLREVDLGATGRASVGAGANTLDVFLLGGQVVAAQAPDDVRHLLRLCAMRGGLAEDVAASLDVRAERGERVFGALLDLAPPELVDQLLFDRFRQNLASFVGHGGKPTFQPLAGVFVDHLQLGHAAAAMIDAAVRLWDDASTLDLDALLVRGRARLDNKEQRLVASKLSDAPQAVSALLGTLPLEPLVARVVILEMLQTGAAVVPSPAGEEDVDDEPTVHSREPVLALVEADAGVARSALTDPPARRRQTFEPPPPRTERPTRPIEESPHDGVRSLTSLSAWLESATRVDDHELDFFSDHDYERGSDEAGAFSTDAHNLDRVEVAGVAETEPLEVDEAPAARFSAPMLSEGEAFEKIAVANEVLTLVVQAFDEAEGAGRGRSVVQLLVDGSPSRFAPLLHDVQVDETGQLPDTQLVDNLYGRPATEHRQLINQALVDIIERALSSAADELPDEQFDHVLESVAGYRQRLGL